MADFLLSVGVDVGLSYTEMQKDIGTLVSQLNNNPPKIKVALDLANTNLSELQAQIDKISKTLNGVAPININAAGAGGVAVDMAGVASNADRAANATRSANAEFKQTQNSVKILSRDSKEYYDALKRVSTLLSQVTNNQKKWSAAQKGKSSGAYNDLSMYAGELEGLISQLRTGEMSAEDFNRSFASIHLGITNASGAIKAAGENTQTWTQRIKGLSEKFATWFSLTRVIMAAFRAARKMVTEVVNIDTAMTELKKVTDETDETYDKFLDDAIVRAKKLGATVEDVVKTSADFARLGIEMEDVPAVSDAALVYKNIGDGIESIDQASESLISTMQAFGIEANDVMSIVDKFNVTGNKFAISSGGVGDALLNSAAALNAAGNSLDESIGLITAANTTIQNPEKVGTALKTISMYLRAAKTEAEEAGESTEGMANSVSELRGEILDLTGNKVDIQLDEDTFKSTYQILKELSVVWDDLTDVSKANITELIGGKRNANVISALLNDFELVDQVIAKTSVSSGSAMEENAKWMESIQGHITELKNAFSELSHNLIDSDIVKTFIDIGTWILETLNWVVSLTSSITGLISVLSAVATVIVFIKGVAITESIVRFMTSLKTGIMNLVYALPNAIAAWKAYAVGIVSANTAIQASIPIIGLVLAAVSAVTAGIALASDSSEELSESIDESTQSFQQLGEEAAKESDNIIELAFSYLEARHALDDLTGTVENYKKARDGLVEGLQIEQTELQKLINQYGDYDKALAAATSSRLRNELINLRGGLTSTIDDTYSKHNGTVGYFTWTSEDGGATHSEPGILVEGDVKLEADLDNAFQKIVDEGLGDGLSLELKKTNAAWDFPGWDGEAIGKVYKFSPNDATEDEVAIYGDAADMVHDYKVYQAALRVLEKAGQQDSALYQAIYNEYASFKDNAEKIIAYVDNINNNLATTMLTDKIAAGDMPENSTEFDSWRQNLIDAAVESGQFSGTVDTITKAIDDVLKQEPRFKRFYNDIASSADKAAGAQKSFSSSLLSINELSKGLNQLDKIYADVYNRGDFDWGSIIGNEEFAEEFGYLGDAYTDFIETVANSPSDINACQDAFNKLTNAYIQNSGVLSGVTEETRDATVAMLEQMGVANAAVIVDEQLALAKERTRIVTEAGEDATLQQILALYNEDTASRITAQAIYELAIAKIKTNENAISTAEDIAQLEALAKSAGATVESLSNLARARNFYAHAETAESNAKKIKEAYGDKWSGWDSYSGINWDSVAKVMREKGDEYRDKELTYDIKFEYTGGSSTKSARDSASKSTQKTEEKKETWFDKQLRDHKHLVAMEKETEAEYLTWLNSAYKKAYKEGIIELDDYYKYQEEVYEGLKDQFRDHLNDVEHEISMREGFEGESDEIISMYEGLMKDVEDEIADARARGLDDSSDYIQELLTRWKEYYESVKDIRESAEEDAKDSIDELVDYRIDMIKQEIEDEKDALNTKLDNLREFYDKQKEMLQDQYDEEKYLEEQAEKRKSVSDIQSELAMLENDDSAWAQKRKLELQEELSQAEDDLGEFEDEHALDLALDALDDAYDAQEAQIQAEMDALDERLNDPEALFNQALNDIKNNTGNLYQEMLEYNRKHGTGNDEDVKDIYENAYKTLLEYEDVYGEPYKGITLPNSTGYKPEEKPKPPEEDKPKDDKPKKDKPKNDKPKSTKPSLSKGSTIKVKTSATHFGSKSGGAKMASFVPGGSYTVYQTSGNQVLIGRNGVYTGWIKKSDIVGYAKGTKNATSGLHRIDEVGSEYLFTSTDGNKYRVLNDGDKVLNAKATDFLYEFANGGGEILEKIIKSAFGTSLSDNIQPVVHHNEITMGDIIVHGSATQQTVSEIRRAQRESLTDMLKSLNKLNR